MKASSPVLIRGRGCADVYQGNAEGPLWVPQHAFQLHQGPKPREGVDSTTQGADAQSYDSDASVGDHTTPDRKG